MGLGCGLAQLGDEAVAVRSQFLRSVQCLCEAGFLVGVRLAEGGCIGGRLRAGLLHLFQLVLLIAGQGVSGFLHLDQARDLVRMCPVDGRRIGCRLGAGLLQLVELVLLIACQVLRGFQRLGQASDLVGLGADLLGLAGAGRQRGGQLSSHLVLTLVRFGQAVRQRPEARLAVSHEQGVADGGVAPGFGVQQHETPCCQPRLKGRLSCRTRGQRVGAEHHAGRDDLDVLQVVRPALEQRQRGQAVQHQPVCRPVAVAHQPVQRGGPVGAADPCGEVGPERSQRLGFHQAAFDGQAGVVVGDVDGLGCDDLLDQVPVVAVCHAVVQALELCLVALDQGDVGRLPVHQALQPGTGAIACSDQHDPAGRVKGAQEVQPERHSRIARHGVVLG